ncbi:MAG: YifB family Mg chelatase-like AAA ATPase [bacterium]
MAFSRVQSAQMHGLGATSVVVETDISRGLYLFQIVGLPDKAVEEARERVISALRNSLGKNPKAENHKVIVSLSPAELKKEGAYFDMAIAIGYLAATEVLTLDMSSMLFVGELGLNGDVRVVRGMLSILQFAKKMGIQKVFMPIGNEQEALLVSGVECYLVPTLADVVHFLQGEESAVNIVDREKPRTRSIFEIESGTDFADIRGQMNAKRALTIAAAGGHNIVLYGPPGTGKTMLAKSFHSILPKLSEEHFLEVATIYSSVGLIDDVLHGASPFRAPHHSASHVAIIGGGTNLRPGDITMAHRGVLYMDEFPEFDRRVIEALREPLEDGSITVARAKGSIRYPARFILLAAMNPCPCGYRGSSIKQCTCSANELARYSKKLSGPIIDRIDLWVPVTHVEYEDLHTKVETKESPILRELVCRTQDIQNSSRGKLNSVLSSREVQEKSQLSQNAKTQLQNYATKLKLSPRAYMRTIKVARTIADLEKSPTIETSHILEALQYRPKIEY